MPQKINCITTININMEGVENLITEKVTPSRGFSILIDSLDHTYDCLILASLAPS